jgi:hypothetical protein
VDRIEVGRERREERENESSELSEERTSTLYAGILLVSIELDIEALLYSITSITSITSKNYNNIEKHRGCLLRIFTNFKISSQPVSLLVYW